MNKLIEIVKRGREGPSLIFRSGPYDFRCPDDFLADVMALANADIVGQRAIILGVSRGEPGERDVPGISFEKLPDGAALHELVDEYIEPRIAIQVVPGDDQKKVAVIIIGDCEAPPYLLKKPCGALMQGAGFIRRDTGNFPLSRSECARLRDATAGQPPEPELFSASQTITVTFEDGGAESELTVIAETDLPSSIAARKLESAIQSRSEVDAMGGADTGIVRLMHVRAFGLDQPFSKKSVDELKDELRNVHRTFELEDKFHRFEKIGHRLNLLVNNEGDEALLGAALILRMQREHGIDVAPAIYALGVSATTRRRELTEVTKSGYPLVRTGPAYHEVACQISPVREHSSLPAFQQPLRVAVSRAAVGKSVPIYYELRSKGGGEPVKGVLRLRVKPTVSA